MRTTTLQKIVDRARILADMRHSRFIDDSAGETIDLLNIIYPEYYDLLVSAYQNYFVAAPHTFAISSTSTSYALPDDFYKMIAVELQVGAGQFASVFQYNELEKNSIVGFSSDSLPSANIRLRYVPAPREFTALTEEIDGVAGWDQLLTYDLAIAMKEAEESDTTSLERKRAAVYKRIMEAAPNRDLTLPGRVTDVTVYSLANVQDYVRYRFYGDNIEFITVDYAGI